MKTQNLQSFDEKVHDDLSIYFSQIKKIRLLTAQEEQDLSKLALKGDTLARKKLVEANLRLVVRIARMYESSGVPLLDLIQEGNIGLMKSAEKYDGTRNVRFSSYAAWWIKQTIIRSLANTRRHIRIPHRKEELLRQINGANQVLTQKLQRAPTVEEISAELGAASASVNDLLVLATPPSSLDEKPTDSISPSNTALVDTRYSPEQLAIKKEFLQETKEMLDKLDTKEKEIILTRFELMGNKRQPLKTIGQKMGVSMETIRQIEKKALQKLRSYIPDKNLPFVS